MVKKVLWIIIGTVILKGLSAQEGDLKTSYARADSMYTLNNQVYNSVKQSVWIDSTYKLWYALQTQRGTEFFILDAETQIAQKAFDPEILCEKLNTITGKKYNPYKLPLRNIKFGPDLSAFTFNLAKVKYGCNLQNYSIKELEKPGNEEPPYWGDAFDELGNDPVYSPDSNYKAYIKDYNVFVKDLKDSTTHQLSFDGSEGSLYSSYLYWSPDSKKLAGVHVRSNTTKYMYFVESSPKDQFLPKLHKREYLRPGDALPIKQPVLFDVVQKKQIPINADPYLNQFSLDYLAWDKDSKAFTFEFNQRGHQVYQVVKVDASTGADKVIVDERSETFIDYSGKRYRYDINGGEKIVWASERSGWNHLYLYDGNTGKVINPITQGQWVVRRVVSVDEEKGQVIFAASGMNKDEDPYFIHYYRVGLNGKGLKELTPEKLNHKATFSADKKYFLDTYSSADTPPVSVLRSTKNGKVLTTLSKADISQILATGYRMPEPFMAKGRDGKTDIWGNIYRPTHFDSTKSYPIIEYIYAGPQGSFVQKSFRPYMYAFSGLCELGFIVVQIDGMGTSNRSKAFHNVCYKNLKDAGFEDRILWIKAAAEKYSYMDTNRVGIFGGSAGGQNSTAALLFHPEFYKVGVSSCGCHDNRMDKIWWNEQWMGYPIGEQYKQSSNIENANRLKGQLMLIVGEMDDNVDPSSTYQLANALIKGNKDFELVVLPGSNHTLGGKFGERKRRDFFVKNLLQINPPQWNGTIEQPTEHNNKR